MTKLYHKYPTRELIVLANRGNPRASSELMKREVFAAATGRKIRALNLFAEQARWAEQRAR